MHRYIRSLWLLPLAAVVATCGDALAPIEGLPRKLSVAESALVDADNRFAFKLFRFMFLIDAIYFKGDWTYQFDRDRTRDETFALTDGSQVSVPTMSRGEETPVRLCQHADYTVLDLWYGGQAYSMTIVVPHDPATIHDVARAVTAQQWDAWTANLDSTRAFVTLPKFTLEYDIELNDVLKALGMEIAFSGGADFSNMIPGGGAYIEKVRHKTFVDVNEEGTEAAAVTSVEMRYESAQPTVRVDRPFLFAIREDYSGSILFMGKVVDPR